MRNLEDGGRELVGGWDVGCGSPSEPDRRALDMLGLAFYSKSC